MQEIYNEIKNMINKSNDFIILDVDRTMINTTSWYQACIEEDLLISKSNIKEFLKINNETFENPNVQKLFDFRKKTLKLINKTISRKYIEKVKEIIGNIYLLENSYTNEWRFYVAGLYTARNLVKTYKEAIQYVKYASKYYGNNLKIIFLTSGYEPFIRGVVDEIIQEHNLVEINYSVIGSKIDFKEGTIKERYHLDQYEKQKIVELIIKDGGKIRMLADDSKDNPLLFETVQKNGGTVLKIEHEIGKEINKTWKTYIDSITDVNVKKYVQKDDSYISLNKKQYHLPEFMQKLERNTNKIGIPFTSKKRYTQSLQQFLHKIKNNDDKSNFNNLIKKFVFEKDNKVYFRGKWYYNRLPQYINITNKTVNENWKDIMTNTIQAMNIIYKNDILNSKLEYNENIIIYAVIDQYLNGMLFLLNQVEQNSLDNNNILEDKLKDIIELTQQSSDLLYAFIYDDKNTVSKLLKNIIQNKEILKLIKQLPIYSKKYKMMRELDDNIIILKFVQNVLKDAEKRKIKFDYIISFPYGGITLGFAINSYMKIVLDKKTVPKLINSHFSSKQKKREGKEETDIEFSIFKYIPQIYKEQVKHIKNGESHILLLDNNVTTFKTIDISKKFLQQIGNQVYAAVPTIYYDNLVNYVLEKDCEKLIPDWRQVLDFFPVGEYVTAFNTWNTSEKTKLLHEIYYNEEKISNIKLTNSKVQQNEFIFKICRIQNLKDLDTVIKYGVNMIGIHAVYPDKIKYLNNELKYKPLENDYEMGERLPIGILELNAIQDMQKVLPKPMKQAILFERPLRIEEMIETCEMYKMPKNNFYIQLQHRTDEEYITNIKNIFCKNIIVAVGLFQKDFEEYFWQMHNILNPKADYILIDLSKHQPDLISYSDVYRESINRMAIFKHLAKKIKNNNVPIILADDTTTEQMEEYLKIALENNIKIKGIDMQNAVEIDTKEQRYQKIEHEGQKYQIKIRKSPTKMSEWGDFINKLDKKIFY